MGFIQRIESLLRGRKNKKALENVKAMAYYLVCEEDKIMIENYHKCFVYPKDIRLCDKYSVFYLVKLYADKISADNVLTVIGSGNDVGNGSIIDFLAFCKGLGYAKKDVFRTFHNTVAPDEDVTITIDKLHTGVACVNSWGAIPLPEYRIPYKDYSFSFKLTPVKGQLQ